MGDTNLIQIEENQPWKLVKRVFPQHTDHAGVVWHGSYLTWLEEARIDALSQSGLDYSTLSSKGYEMPVVSLKIKYLNSLRHGDTVVLNSWSLRRQLARFPWETKFFKSDGLLVAEAFVDLVLVRSIGGGFRLVREMPDEFLYAFTNLQNGPNLKANLF